MKLSLLSFLAVGFLCSTAFAAAPTYLLKSELPPGTTSHVTVKLESGGDQLMPTDTDGVKKLPLKLLCNLDYHEQLVAWSAEPTAVARAIRQYDTAVAKAEIADRVTNQSLANDRHPILAEVRDGLSVVTGGEANLTRQQVDMVNQIANTLAIDRLLPGKEMAEGDSWQHDTATMQALLGMDHVGVCEVSSVVAAESDRQVQIRLAGTVHGTVDGTPTERELRAAYLFHLDQKRIVRFNLAIKEVWKANAIVAGLDVVTKAFVTIDPATKEVAVPAKVKQIAERTTQPLSRTLVYESPSKAFRMEYSDAWYQTAEELNKVSFRYLSDHEEGAFCNISVLPARSAGRHTPLEEFERDVRHTVGDLLEVVNASTEWDTKRGYHCLGVIADGKVTDIPMQWRHYLLSADDCPRVAVAVSVERDRVSTFADADRPIIEAIELLPSTPGANAYGSPTASAKEGVTR
jgi:hypothetical protein